MEPNPVAAAVAAVFDISQYELADTSTLTFKDKRGKDNLIGADGVSPAQARLYSPSSPQGIRAMVEYNREIGMLTAQKVTDTASDDYEQKMERAAAKRYAAFTESLINFPVDAMTFYMNHRLVYLHRQVEAHITKYANF